MCSSDSLRSRTTTRYAETPVIKIDGFTGTPTSSLPIMARVDITGGGERWEARDGADTVGVVRAGTRPDRRTFLSFRDCRDDAYAPLLAQAAAELHRPLLYTSVHEKDEIWLRRLGDLGFVVSRRDHHYRIPVDPGLFRLPDAAPPPGIMFISAADADLDRLRLLDDTLRNQTPGVRRVAVVPVGVSGRDVLRWL